MLPAMTRKPGIAIVGPGRLGRALALELTRAGYAISEIVSRNREGSKKRARELAREVGARPSISERALLDADVVWFCVPDRRLLRRPVSLLCARSGKEKLLSTPAVR